eukprot:3315362-Rhodomonas_salina.9
MPYAGTSALEPVRGPPLGAYADLGSLPPYTPPTQCPVLTYRMLYPPMPCTVLTLAPRAVLTSGN